VRKNLDLIVYNPLDTMSSKTIESVLLYPDGRSEELPMQTKADFACFRGVTDFIVGYGMDDAGAYRGLPYIGKI